MKILSLIFLSVLLVWARENPFAPSSLQGGGVNQVTPQSVSPMEAEKLRLPVDTVRLNRVSVTYQRIDGRIETKTFEINKALAADKPLIIEQR